MTERREKFVQLAESRVNRALNDIRLIGNLSNRANYEFNDEDVAKITLTLKRAIKEMNARFKVKEEEPEEDFKL